MNAKRRSPTSITVSSHAQTRARQRVPALRELGRDALKKELRHAACHSTIIGLLRDPEVACMEYDGYVMVVAPDRRQAGSYVIRTVCTPAEARRLRGFLSCIVRKSPENSA